MVQFIVLIQNQLISKKFEDLSEIDLNQSLSMQLGSAIIFSQKIIEYFLKKPEEI